MRDKVVLGITLTVVLLATLAIYGLVDLNRQPATQAADQERSENRGKKIYAQYCVQCHGPLGEGCVGPALDRIAWRAEIDGSPNPDFDEGSTEVIKKTIRRGRASNQPGVQMPPWSIEEGGALNEEEIDDLTVFIQYGDWSQVIENVVSAQNLDQPVPSFPGFEDPAQLQQVKDLMLSKGCLTCHIMGKPGGAVGANLTEVGSRRTADWLHRWIDDPTSVPPEERGPNLWLIAPTPSLETPGPNAPPTATPQVFPMNPSYMPNVDMTDEELDLLVDYLSHARLAQQ